MINGDDGIGKDFSLALTSAAIFAIRGYCSLVVIILNNIIYCKGNAFGSKISFDAGSAIVCGMPVASIRVRATA